MFLFVLQRNMALIKQILFHCFLFFLPVSLLKAGTFSIEEYMFRHGPTDNLIVVDIYSIK